MIGGETERRNGETECNRQIDGQKTVGTIQESNIYGETMKAMGRDGERNMGRNAKWRDSAICMDREWRNERDAGIGADGDWEI